MLCLTNNNFAYTVAIIALLSVQVSLVYGGPLDYQNRGEYWEGIAHNPVAESDIELLSALIDYREDWYPLPANCKLKFYLQHATAVDITVQELRPKHNYKMERIIPKSPWRQGINDYQWATNEVIAQLRLKITQLGIIASLKPAAKSDVEYIAPVLIYHSVPPTKINGYLFAFKVGDCAMLSYVVYQGKNVDPIAAGKISKQSVSEPFVIYWDSSLAKEGSYELIVDGYFLKNNKPIYKSVQFYHKPSFKGDK